MNVLPNVRARARRLPIGENLTRTIEKKNILNVRTREEVFSVLHQCILARAIVSFFYCSDDFHQYI